MIRDSNDRRAGFQISDFADGQGEIALFFELGVTVEFKRDFVDFVQQHIFELAAAGSIRTRKVFRCRSCTTEFTDAQIGGRKSRGFSSISCSVCGADNPLSLIEESARVSAPTRNTAVAIASAQEAAEREANVAVGSAMVQSSDIRRWLGEGAREAHVVIVFTDIVSSTKANNDLGELAMEEIKEAHFATLTRNAARYKGRILKNTGDGVLAIFRTTPQAVQFALSSAIAPGHDDVQIRAGIHVGRVKPRDNEIFGQTVNFAARVQSSLPESGVILSDEAKQDLERLHGAKQAFFSFKIREGQEFKGFDGKYTLWLINKFDQAYLKSVR